jgi:hypothetical protein
MGACIEYSNLCTVDSQPVADWPLWPNPGKPPDEVTPACEEEIEVALTVPFLAFVPCTVTVSPGRSAEREDFAFRFTVVLEPTVTATSWPLESVTYRV